MNTSPAKAFGRWLRLQRQARQLTAREFAIAIGLASAEYAEVELGIVEWITDAQEQLIPKALEFSPQEVAAFESSLTQAREATPITFESLFKDRDQLAPVRACTPYRKQLTEADRENILKAVFAPLR